MNYLFTSDRLGFRNWKSTDIDALNELNNNSEVMQFFPELKTESENIEFIERMQSMFKKKGYCYFVVELIETREFIGFIGLAYQDYISDFTPATDIGWRLLPKFWNKGYATEGAERVIKFAKNDLNLTQIISVAPVINVNSIGIMKKIGLTHQYNFLHSELKDYKSIQQCSLYSVNL